MAQVKCQWCQIKGEKVDMVREHPKGYIHPECIPKYIEDKRFKQLEREEKDKLAAKIVEVYEVASIQMIPTQIWPYIEDIRNDSKLFGRLGKSYKNGIPYSGIAYTFEYCKDRIRDARKSKEFKNFMMELRYGLAIIRNSLADAKEHSIYAANRKKEHEKMKEIRVEKDMSLSYEKNMKNNRKDELDISELI